VAEEKPEVKDRSSSSKAQDELFTIEALAEKLQVKPWIMAGLKAAYNWGAGKMVSEKEFISKRDTWLNGPLCRK